MLLSVEVQMDYRALKTGSGRDNRGGVSYSGSASMDYNIVHVMYAERIFKSNLKNLKAVSTQD
jgi:hypothetical protein